ncbi:MAG: carboxymuconolactone decarboxylase family protein, partial [Alphaproteobacteria bacterium]
MARHRRTPPDPRTGGARDPAGIRATDRGRPFRPELCRDRVDDAAGGARQGGSRVSRRPYPADIDPQSQCRLPLPRRDELDAEGQRVFDSLADPQGGSLRGLRGPGGIHLHSPELARHTRPLNRYLRQQAGLGGRLRELAILVTARELDSQFEWAAHEAEARREGLSPEIIETIRHRRDTGGLDEADAVVIALGREIFTARKVSSTT